MLIDTHVHVSSADPAAFPTLPLPEGRTPWWVEPMPLDRMLRLMDTSGVDRVVLIHAFGAYGNDNSYVLSVAGDDPARVRAVCGVDTDHTAAAGTVSSSAAVPGVAGIRVLALGTEPDSDPWLDDGRAESIWDAAAALGDTVIVCARGTGLARLLPHVAGRPDVPVVLDDCGVPELDGDRIPAGHPVFSFTDLPHVAVKVFSPMLLAAQRAGSSTRLVDQVVGSFGADRVAWGSNFPQSGIEYPTLVAAAHRATASLTTAQADAVLGATAHRLWFARREHRGPVPD